MTGADRTSIDIPAGPGFFTRLAQAVVGRCGERRRLAEIKCMAVVVDAKDEGAATFYRHYGFLTLQAQPRRLFVPMATVAQLLGK